MAPGALAGARGADAASHSPPAGPPGVGGPGDASAVRWGGLGGKNDGERPSRTWQQVIKLAGKNDSPLKL